MSKDSGLDLVAVLVWDHREIESMLGDLERIPQSARRQCHHAASALVRELVRHRETEAQCLYSVAREFLPGGDQLVEQDRRAWSDAAAILGGVADADPGCERLGELIERLISWTRHHVHRQEKEVLAELSKHADRGELEWLGDEVQALNREHANSSVTQPPEGP